MNDKQKLYDKLSKLLTHTPNEFKVEKAKEFCLKHGLEWRRVKKLEPIPKITPKLTRTLPQLPFDGNEQIG